jgi:putative peptidoglycan lipid II flippase
LKYTPAMSLFKSVSTVSLLTLASRITGLVRELLVASAFGASAMTDAFNVAFRIPNLFRRLFAEGAFSQAFVPVLAASRVQQGDDTTRQLVNDVTTVLCAALLLTCVLGVAGAPVMVWMMASGLKHEGGGFEAAVFMTRWMFPYIGFMSLVALAAGVLNTWRRFAIPAATPVLLNMAMILAAWQGAPWLAGRGIEPVYAMAGGVLLGGMMQLGIQIPVLFRLGLLPHVRLTPAGIRAAWSNPGTRRIGTLMLPALLGVGVAQLSLLINTQIASHLAPGSVSWITYADRLMEFPTALLGVALGVVLMPQLAQANGAQDAQRYSALLDWGLRLVVVLAVPCSVALLVFATPLVATLYHYGAFTDLDVIRTAHALMGWGVGLLGLVAVKVLAPGYYASQDVKTPVRIAVAVLVVTQVLNVVLVPVFAHAALTLSIGLGAMLNAGWLWVGLLRSGRLRPTPGWGLFVMQVVAACALLAVFLLWCSQAVDWTALKTKPWERIGLLALVLSASGAIYFASLSAAGMKLKQLLHPSVTTGPGSVH